MVVKNHIPSVHLANEHRTAIPTADAAAHLGRRSQTLRSWACKGCGPIKPIKIHGRLAWLTSDLKKLLGVG